MTELEYLKKIHMEILDIMDYIHSVCEKNKLHYYLTGGSLLGAVRHGGFIPWDDDLDIAMPREDYDRLITIVNNDDNGNKFKILNIKTDKTPNNLHTKITKKGTLFSESTSNGLVFDRGIFVDIFPLDDTDGITTMTKIQKSFSNKIKRMIVMNTFPKKFKGIKKYISCMIPKNLLIKAVLSVMCRGNNKGKKYYTNFASQYPIERKTQLKTVYGKGKPISFENRKYMAPDDYKTDLLSNFGPKYMELPPVEKRRAHYPDKVIFSDGTVFEPKKDNVKKVSIKESLEW